MTQGPVYLCSVSFLFTPLCSATPITRECAITLDDLAPSQLVEYKFSAEGPWMVGNVSFAALEEYRKVKFGYWKNLMVNPACEAPFKRMLKIGCVAC